MRVDVIEIEWQRRLALNAIACSLSELKCLAAEVRLERAMRRYGQALKYGYNPAQPRVPKGEDGAGEWTEGTDANGNSVNKKPKRDDLVRLAGEWPSNDPPEPIDDKPKNLDKEPATSAERTSVIKWVAREVARTGATVAAITGMSTWLLLREPEIISYNDPPKSLDELQGDLSPKSGYQRHHIVEQTPARNEGYPDEVIEGADNLARVPTKKHEEITAWYNTKNQEYGGVTPRRYLDGRSWSVRRAVGLDAMKIFGVLKP